MIHLPFAKLFKWWPYHSPSTNNTVSANSYISQIPTDDTICHNYSLQNI